MSIQNKNKIDYLGIREGRLSLGIADALSWDSSEFEEHVTRIQEKIELYLDSIESGSIFEERPDYRGLPVEIELIGEHEPSPEALDFFEYLRSELSQSGWDFQFSRVNPEKKGRTRKK